MQPSEEEHDYDNGNDNTQHKFVGTLNSSNAPQSNYIRSLKTFTNNTEVPLQVDTGAQNF